MPSEYQLSNTKRLVPFNFGFDHQNLDEDVPRDMAYVTQHKNLSSEPKANWKEVEYIMPRESFQTATTGEEEQLHRLDRLRSSGSSMSFRRGSSLIKSLRQSIVVGFEDGVLVDLIRHTERPTEFHSIHDLEDNEVGYRLCIIIQGLLINELDHLFHFPFHLPFPTILVPALRLLEFFAVFSGNNRLSTPRRVSVLTHGTSVGSLFRSTRLRLYPIVRIPKSTA